MPKDLKITRSFYIIYFYSNEIEEVNMEYVSKKSLKYFLNRLIHRDSSEENPVTLYETNSTESQLSINLSDYASNYYMIDVIYGCVSYGAGLSSVRIYSPNTKTFRADASYAGGNPTKIYSVHSAWEIQGTTISRCTEESWAINHENLYSCGSAQVYIAKVIGYRNVAPKYALCMYPIGSIYLSINNVNPSELFGGTWKQVAQGKTLIGVDSNDADFNTPQKTGGEKSHTLTVDELPGHTHNTLVLNQTDTGYDYDWMVDNNTGDRLCLWLSMGNKLFPVNDGDLGYVSKLAQQATGSSQPHNNLPPYFTCYIWLRTA